MTTELRRLIDQLGAAWTGDPAEFDDLLAEDVVVETPFTATEPRTWTGRAEWLAFARPSRERFPVRFDRFVVHALHETVDPEVAVVEYELGGVLPDGGRAAARFVGILRARDGKVTGWREYPDTLAFHKALSGHAG